MHFQSLKVDKDNFLLSQKSFVEPKDTTHLEIFDQDG